MTNILNILPNAVGPQHAQIVYAEVTTPLPQSFEEPLYLVLPDWSRDFAISVIDWPAVHGITLPLLGNSALLLVDNRGDTRCVWWDGSMTFATQSSLLYYLTPTADPVGGLYLQQTITAQTSQTPLPYSSISGTSTVQDWITNSSNPSLGFLPAGQFEFHIHAAQTAGDQTVQVYAEFWESNAAGADIGMIGQTQVSAALTGDTVEQRLFFSRVDVYTLASTSSRITCRLKAIVGGVGNASMSVYVGGTTDSHIVIPAIGSTPVGPAGGVLTGSYPNPTLASLNWQTIPSFFTGAGTGNWAGAGYSGLGPAQYAVDGWGLIHLRGSVSNGSAFSYPVGPNLNIAVLPVGARPASPRLFFCPGQDTAGHNEVIGVIVDTSGILRLQGVDYATPAGNNGLLSFMSLDQIPAFS